MAPFAILTARPDHLPAIHAIQAHYVLHSLLNFCYEPVSLEEMKADYAAVIAEGYPYFVAVSSSGDGNIDSATNDDVQGYAYVHAFRDRAAYQYTGELSIFCRPECTGGGIGKALLDACISFLRESKKLAKAARDSSRKSLEVDTVVKDTDERALHRPKDIHQLVACMTVNPDRSSDDRLKRFYAREGFVETAVQKQVGWKWGQWLDTRVMQLAL